MAEDDSSSRFGLDEPVFGFMGEGTAVSDANSDPSVAPTDTNAQAYYGSSPWDFQMTPSFDAFDVNSAVTAPPVTTGPMAPSWPLSAFDQSQSATQPHQNPQPQMQIPSPSIDGFPPPKMEPNTVYGFHHGNPRPRKLPMTNSMQTRVASGLSHEELRNIAMPPHLQYHSPKSASSPDSAHSDIKGGAGSSPEMSGSMAKKDSRKRKVSDELEDDDDVEDEDKPVKKTAHNMIEKRYRTNINDKIAALRDSVPSLRIMSKSARGEDTTEDREELHGLTPAHKLNKATVLSKATEYIRHLEKRNSRLLDENTAMKERIAAFEKLFMAGAMNGSISPLQHPPTPMQYPQDPQPRFANSPLGTPQESNASTVGMISVPEDMKRIISAQMAAGQPYPVPQQPFRGGNPTVMRQQQIQQQQQQQQQMQQNGWVNASPFFGKLMVGSLAGLMILEAVQENEISNEKPEGRGLLAVPVQLARHLSSMLDLHIMGYHLHTSLKLLLFFGAILWVFVPSLFASRSEKLKKQHSATLKRAPSLASSIHVRRQAWLTAIQTVWVPRHNFFLEASALILKAVKLSMRNAIGIHGYQVLTGLTEEQETARVKAWSIALDSQLAGGDVDICKSRLVLTLLAAETLPDTPARLMLKALHMRVLLWDLSNSNWQLGLVNAIATRIARKRWNEARQLNRALIRSRRGSVTPHEHELPDHLVALVEEECDDVLSAAVLQRAHNLAFNMETTHNVDRPMDGMDAVVDDTAVGSPMDAVAAWWSTQILHGVLTASLDDESEELDTRAQKIDTAIQFAPQGSVARTRAVLARAILVEKAREENLDLARQVMASSKEEGTIGASALIFGTPCSSPDLDLTFTLDCASALARLSQLKSAKSTSADQLDFVEAIAKSEHMSSMSLLSFTALMELMKRLLGQEDMRLELEVTLGKLSSNLRLWMGRPCAKKCGVSSDLRNKVVETCLAATKSLTGPDNDTGYGSLSDNEDLDA